jgi:hypothetical protein
LQLYKAFLRQTVGRVASSIHHVSSGSAALLPPAINARRIVPAPVLLVTPSLRDQQPLVATGLCWVDGMVERHNEQRGW